MPEGPEVRVMTDMLVKEVQAKTLQAIHWNGQSRYHKKGLPSYESLSAQLPFKVIQIDCHGKKIIMTLENDWYVVCSPLMSGKFLLQQGGHSGLWFTFVDGSIIYFDDQRHMGLIEIIQGKATLERKMSKLGPDLLKTEVTSKQWLEVFRKPRMKNMQICKALMDQKYFSGCGNYLKAEVLYRCKIKPDRLLGDLTDDQLDEVRSVLLEIIRHSYRSQGHSFMSYTDLNGDKGSFQVKVYRHKQDPHGNPVRKDTFKDGRGTYWVPTVQV